MNIQKSIFGKLGIFTLLLCLVLVLSLFEYLNIKVSESNNIAKKITAELTSQSVVDMIDRNFYERFGDVQAFAYNKLAKEALSTGHIEVLVDFINTMTTYYVLYDIIMVCDINGRPIAVNGIDKEGNAISSRMLHTKNFAREEWFIACTSAKGPEGGAWFSQFTHNTDVGNIYKSQGHGMAFAAPIRSESGQILGVWYNFASWDEVTRAIRAQAEEDLRRTEPDASIFITTKDGILIDARDAELIDKRINLLGTDFEKHFKLLKPESQIGFKDHISQWASAKGAYTYKGNNWKAVTIIPASKASLLNFFSKDLLKVYLTILSIISLAAFLIYRYVKKHIIDRMHGLDEILSRIAQGEVVHVDNTLRSDDEIGKMATSLSKVTDNIQKIARFASDIGKGDLDMDFDPSSEKDVLGNALVEMRDNLKRLKEEEQQRNYITEGLTRFGEITRQHAGSFEEMASVALCELIKYTKANQGILYVAEKDDKQQVVLRSKACYAWDRKKYLNHEILPGEGLIGQAYQEGEPIFLTEIPQHYIKLSSGLGSANPSCILIIPMRTNEEIVGVIELASFEVIPPFKVDLIKKVSDIMATMVQNLSVSLSTQALLEKTQIMTEELRAQEEEMRQNMEELQATQEEMQRREKDLLDQIEMLRNNNGQKDNPTGNLVQGSNGKH